MYSDIFLSATVKPLEENVPSARSARPRTQPRDPSAHGRPTHVKDLTIIAISKNEKQLEEGEHGKNINTAS
jgi:hypothetical protein